MYKVISPFLDLKNGKHLYQVGDTYPMEGCRPSKARITELSGSSNKIGKPLIEEVKDESDSE